MLDRLKEIELAVRLGIYGSLEGNSIEDNYFMREARENAIEQGYLDIESIGGLSDFERQSIRANYVMEDVELTRTERKEDKQERENYIMEQREQNKQSNSIEWLDFKSTKHIRTGDTTVSLSKKIKWNKERKGVVDKSFLILEIVHDGKKMKILIGAKEQNVWAGITERSEVKVKAEQLELSL